MSSMRFNHMELSFPRGTLTKEFRDEVDVYKRQGGRDSARSSG